MNDIDIYGGGPGVVKPEGQLATAWDVETASGFSWSLTAPCTFDLLVMQHGWSTQSWADSTFRLLRDVVNLDVRRDPPHAATTPIDRTSR